MEITKLFGPTPHIGYVGAGPGTAFVREELMNATTVCTRRDDADMPGSEQARSSRMLLRIMYFIATSSS
jgi:hypothetical protein